jgi:hypothetical protein
VSFHWSRRTRTGRWEDTKHQRWREEDAFRERCYPRDGRIRGTSRSCSGVARISKRPLPRRSTLDSLVPQGESDVSDDGTDQQRQEGQFGNGQRHSVHFGVNKRETLEERVEDGVDESLRDEKRRQPIFETRTGFHYSR